MLDSGRTSIIGANLLPVVTKRYQFSSEKVRKSIGMTAKMLELEAKQQINYPPKDSETLETLGLLAGGIAHDFNNLLTSIIGQTSLALATLPAESKARRYVENSLQAAETAAVLTQQLLNYANNKESSPEEISINQFIRDNLILFNMFLLNGSSLQLDLAPALPPVKASRAHVQQILMNMVLNAAEALQNDDDTVTIKTGRELINGQEDILTANGRTLSPGEYITIQIIDTGRGMDEATLAKIFQPFFTTKQHGRGLGLSTILEIVTRDNGGIHVQSKPGHGTAFTIYLPKFFSNQLHWSQLH
jgi:signal transduction histidine kinase